MLPEAAHHHKPAPFDVDYNIEGARVGYKWFESQHETPLFPFGYGLSYTTYAFSDLKVDAAQHTATFTVSNTGPRGGTEVAQVYAVLPASTGEDTYKRLVGWDRVTLAPGESKTVTVDMNQLTLSIFDVAKNAFVMVAWRLHHRGRLFLGGHPAAGDHARGVTDHDGRRTLLRGFADRGGERHPPWRRQPVWRIIGAW